jgi:NAD(P)-dependent dehydrogenase (short-subunit alcohol dehydrogenase family)
MMNLNEKIIVVVGGATGIGRASAALCRERGATVIIADQAVPADWEAELYGKVDVTDESSVAELFEHIGRSYNRVDALIQTAGILKGGYLKADELALEIFQQVLDVNMTGTFLCSKYALPLLRKSSRGVMILFSSIAATLGSTSLAYGASKGGVNGLAITLMNQLAGEGIRVNVVAPGNIDTSMKRGAMTADPSLEKSTTALENRIAAANLGTAEGVAKILAWLVSDDADYVRGVITTR